VAATEEGGGSDGGRERHERVTRRWCSTERVHVRLHLRLRVVAVVRGGRR